MHNFADRRSV